MLKTAWIHAKSSSGSDHFASGVGEWIDALTIGLLPGWAVLAAICAFFAGLALLCAKPRERDRRLMRGSAHV